MVPCEAQSRGQLERIKEMLCYSEGGFSSCGVADGYIPKQGEVLFVTTPTDQQLDTAFPGYVAAKATIANNVQLIQQIQVLEAIQTLRLLREVTLGSTAVYTIPGPLHGMTPMQVFTYLDTQIAALRAQLK